jgi:hypothetical protein
MISWHGTFEALAGLPRSGLALAAAAQGPGLVYAVTAVTHFIISP